MADNALLTLGADPFDLYEIAASLQKRGSFTTVAAGEVTDSLFTPSLFTTEERVLIVQDAEKLKKNGCMAIVRFLERAVPGLFLWLVSASSVPQELEKRIPVEDYRGSKPWEKEVKKARWITSYLKEVGLAISSQLATQLAKECGDDPAGIRNELEKLATYCDGRKEVVLQDIKAVMSLESTSTLWQLSEAFLQKNGAQALVHLKALQAQEIHWIVIARHLRHAVHQALMMLSLSKNVREHFPQLRGSLFDKQYTLAKSCSMSFLREALIAIDTLEGRLKDSCFDEEGLVLESLGRMFI